jgi:NAD(P)-dependent dehydrogenase (short-subunit alcohol dehydrogenase family)
VVSGFTRKYLPGMLKKNWGRVIFISSESGQHIPELIHYGMTKTAQVAVSFRSLSEASGAFRDWRRMPPRGM